MEQQQTPEQIEAAKAMAAQESFIKKQVDEAIIVCAERMEKTPDSKLAMMQKKSFAELVEAYKAGMLQPMATKSMCDNLLLKMLT